MKKTIYLTAVISSVLFVIFFMVYENAGIGSMLTLAITSGTTAYHFLMRLFVGFLFDTFMKNKADHSKKWYQCSKWEEDLYKRMKVKHWKNKLPSFKPEYFDTRKHSLDETAQAMCQAEIVHETIIVLSFVPIIFSVWFGALPVFVITSVFSAAVDLIFVIIQRYNRPRIIKLIGRK